MGKLSVLATAFSYPYPGCLEDLQLEVTNMPSGPARQHLAAFLARIRRLSLPAWEELYTRTLDLDPSTAPYVGFQTWGESYQRGTFLSHMSAALQQAGVSPGGELPDHLAPVLLYLDSTEQPLPELLEVLEPAIQRMHHVLQRRDPHNPYISLLQAAIAYVQDLPGTSPGADSNAAGKILLSERSQ